MSDLISRQAAIDAIESAKTAQTPDGEIYVAKLNAEMNIQILPSVEPELCEDAVSRQRLLSDLKELIAAWKKYPIMAERIKGVETAIGYVKVIPSVKQDSKELSSTHKALDTISRQAALDICNYTIDLWEGRIGEGALIAVRNSIAKLPSVEPEKKLITEIKLSKEDIPKVVELLRRMPLQIAEPERKTGEWICQPDDDIWNCSKCDFEIDGTGCIDPLKYLETYKYCPNCGCEMKGFEEDE